MSGLQTVNEDLVFAKPESNLQLPTDARLAGAGATVAGATASLSRPSPTVDDSYKQLKQQKKE